MNLDVKKRQRSENGERFICRMIRIILGIYLLVMFSVYPLTLKTGYYMITDGKYELFKSIHILLWICMGVLLSVLGISSFVKRGIKESFRRIGRELTNSDYCLMLFLVLLFLSTILSKYRETALYGFRDWYMGFFMYLNLCLVSLILSKFVTFKKFFLHVLSWTSGIICLTGFLQRMNIHVIHLQGFQLGSSDLSTLGNVNWACGYLSIVLLVMLYLFFDSVGIFRLICGIPIVAVYLFLAVQGSSSGWIVVFLSLFFSLEYCLLNLSFMKLRALLTLLLLCMLSVFSGCYFYQFRVREGKTILYENVPSLFQSKGIFTAGMIVLCSGILILVLTRKKTIAFDRKKGEAAAKILGGVGAGAVFLVAVMMLVHGFNQERFPFLDSYSALCITPEWGHDRGGNWMISLKAFQKSGFLCRFFGYGPDCLYYCINEHGMFVTDWSYAFISRNPAIANAHNECITFLINLGFSGTFSYYLFLGVSVKELLQKNLSNQFTIFVAFAVLTSFLHNTVSFQQILSTPYLFILLGIAKSSQKKELQNRIIKQDVIDTK